MDIKIELDELRNRIANFLEQNGSEGKSMTLREFAERVKLKTNENISHGTIDNFLKGGMPSLEVFFKLLTAIDTACTFVPTEQLNFYNAFEDVSDKINSISYDEEDIEFLNKPESHPFILLAQTIYETKNYDSKEAKRMAKAIGVLE